MQPELSLARGMSLMAPALAGRFFMTSTTWEAICDLSQATFSEPQFSHL